MPPLRVEVFIPDDDTWHVAGDVSSGQMASISARNPDGTRDVYAFGADEATQRGYIEMAVGSTDRATLEERDIHALGFIPVAYLSNGESYEMQMVTDTSKGEMRRLRFTYYRD